ncbi:rCG36899 [Rattus norvegicus]|uniref:RCG36899 n=1 Tax=Rattus norvegicus TaxID=10116 RepID=A6HUC1_RAT|nr:rCG36899 [Rattus norvegicus]
MHRSFRSVKDVPRVTNLARIPAICVDDRWVLVKGKDIYGGKEKAHLKEEGMNALGLVSFRMSVCMYG